MQFSAATNVFEEVTIQNKFEVINLEAFNVGCDQTVENNASIVWVSSYDALAATVSLSWNEVKDATDYTTEVSYNGKNRLSVSVSEMTTVNGIVTGHISGVNPGSSREYRVSAVTEKVFWIRFIPVRSILPPKLLA